MARLIVTDWIPPGYRPIEAVAEEMGSKQLRDDLSEGVISAATFHPRRGSIEEIKASHWRRAEAASWLLGNGYILDELEASRGTGVIEFERVAIPIIIRSDYAAFQSTHQKLEGSGYRPPIIAVITATVEALKINDVGPWPKLEAIADEMRKQGLKLGYELSPNKAKSAATLVRPKEAEKGGNQKWIAPPTD